MKAFGLAVTLVFLAFSAVAQSPSADWRTLETPHFRVHFPAGYEEWTMRAATRLEAVRDAVSAEIGFTAGTKIDVVVTNPIAQPNGIAFPLLDTPRIILFTDSPAPDEEIGAYAHWIDLLTVHEVAHIVHMLRPSRDPWQRLLERTVLPLNPITLRAPRWVLEGYATVIEGRLTGAGRPTSVLRAAVLRKWAQSGRLPSYGQLNSDQRFMGMSMAYLAGSAYLEWLERRAGEGSLRKLWARMTARQRRSFAQAFEGVYGDSPERLYGRFAAELTESALAVERAGALREGELWQETSRASGDPAVSPDGAQIAVVIRPREGRQRLAVYSTAPPDEEEKKFRERIEKMLARDPEDVAPVRTKPLPREEKHSLVLPEGGDITSPRWLRGGGAILFTHRTMDREGFLHRDLFVWTLATNDVRRVTHLADVGDADPFPGDQRAIAVRTRFGKSQLVTVDLATGEVTPNTDASVEVVYSHPRVSPDGSRVAYVAHREGSWGLYVDERRIASATAPAWLSDQELVATIGADVHRIALDGTTAQLTRSSGMAVDPAPSRDGRVFFMGLEPDGFVLRAIDANAPPLPPLAAYDRDVVPALPPLARAVTPLAIGEVSKPRPYGIGRQELGWFAGQNYADEHRAFELGLRLGDIVGRLDTIVLGSIGTIDGAAIATAWRGWPVEVGAHVSTEGSELSAAWTYRSSFWSAATQVAAFTEGDPVVWTTLSTRHFLGKTRIREALQLTVTSDVRRVAASIGTDRIRLSAEVADGETVVGGLASSILPRSAYAARILDPALPPGMLAGDDYVGWRVETAVPVFPGRVFYQRHEAGGARLSLAGLEFEFAMEPYGILKTPGLALTVGAARLFDADRTKIWIGMRWTP
jgi:WD40-like Beta Propeller Repeat